MEPESNPTPPPQPTATGWSDRIRGLFANRIILVAAATIILGLAAAGAYFLTKPKAAPTGQNGLQDVSADELKKFTNSFLKPTTTQTVNINPNAHFNNEVTVDKTLTAGAISTKNFNVTGAVSIDSLDVKNGLSVGGATLLQGNIEARQQLTVRGALAAASASFSGNVSVGGNLAVGSLAVGSLTTTNITASGDVSVGGHLKLNGSPVSATAGVASGGGSASVSGSDVTGTVTINIGGSPVAGQLATINFSKPYTAAPHVILTPVNADAGSTRWYVVRAASFFYIGTTTPASSGQSLQFDYFITE